MTESVIRLADINPAELDSLSDDDFRAVVARLIELQAVDRKENQLVYYQPASESCRKVHTTRARYIGIGGGNGAAFCGRAWITSVTWMIGGGRAARSAARRAWASSKGSSTSTSMTSGCSGAGCAGAALSGAGTAAGSGGTSGASEASEPCGADREA